MKKENDLTSKGKAPPLSPSKLDQPEPTTGLSMTELERRLKEAEKRVTKMRNENQEQKILIEKATRLLERETGEIVDIQELIKEES